MKQIGFVVAGILAVLVGMGFIMPALAQIRNQGALPAQAVEAYTLGVFLVTATVTGGVCSMLQKFARR